MEGGGGVGGGGGKVDISIAAHFTVLLLIYGIYFI